ncbi:Diaminopimelate decarboxylase [Geodia barretti]|uniref:Diaminopimelate decarboxylase n=1 Tax=Geodia barretti TaxID=519541 RepID=A0AA35U3Y1_GEOBA|nr:Diaminopimelate decarboxylase [Geodia barretti]
MLHQHLSHVFPDTADTDDAGHLTLGGCDTVQLAEQYGTPLYVLDEATLRNRCRQFSSAFAGSYPNTGVVYASKAGINPALVRIFTEEGLGLDVVSGGELAMAVSGEMPLDRVYFHGSNKSASELEEAVSAGIGRIVVDNFHELDLLEQICANEGKRQDILVRVCPGIDPHTHAYTTTGIIDSKFGFSIPTGDAERAILCAIAAPRLNLLGLHFHLGSPIFELGPYTQAIDLVLRFAAGLREKGLNLQVFSPGGGFAIAYTRKDKPPSARDYADVIVSALTATCEELHMELPRLVVEPGRSIIGPAGVTLYRVGAIKTISRRPHVRQRGRRHKRQHSSGSLPGPGKCCESGDVLASGVELPAPVAGDVIAVPATGAYSSSMASNYNLNPRPPIVLVNERKSRLIRRRESYADMMLCDL